METNNTPEPKILYNKEWNDYAYWNGSQYVGKIVGANFYGLEKAANNNYLPITPSQENALNWWDNLRLTEKVVIMNKFEIKQYRSSESLLIEEIEEIWRKENNIQ